MYQEPPKVEYDKDIERLIKYYQQAYKEILSSVVDLANIPDSEDVYQRQAALLQQVGSILAQLNTENKIWCEQMIKQAYTNGQAAALLSTGMAVSLLAATNMVQFSQLSQQTVDALINDTYNDLLAATSNTERRIKQIVRQTVGNVLRQRTAKNFGRKTISKDIASQLTKKGLSEKVNKDGFVGIVDKAGRRWDVKRYAEMVTRTKLNQAHVEGVRTSGIERGIDLAVISTHNAEDECNHYEGMIISLNGITEGLLSYDEIRNTNRCFHPNCQHKVHLVKPSLLPKAVKDKHASKVAALPYRGLKMKIKPLEDIKMIDKEEVRKIV